MASKPKKYCTRDYTKNRLPIPIYEYTRYGGKIINYNGELMYNK
jgi:hypothetical protein